MVSPSGLPDCKSIGFKIRRGQRPGLIKLLRHFGIDSNYRVIIIRSELSFSQTLGWGLLTGNVRYKYSVSVYSILTPKESHLINPGMQRVNTTPEGSD